MSCPHGRCEACERIELLAALEHNADALRAQADRLEVTAAAFRRRWGLLSRHDPEWLKQAAEASTRLDRGPFGTP